MALLWCLLVLRILEHSQTHLEKDLRISPGPKVPWNPQMLIKDYNSRITVSLVRNMNFQITPQTSLSGKDADSLMFSYY